ncbi:hypothetical protein LCGC14_0487680 [marine sediment metagenome]|uniref:Glycosyltransferase family 9 (Heptosyltransferase) n=1 Tax=marine sediment metagenome TaxID=412755 RepID=A0A0F9VGE1_9ZZZZ
MQSTKILVTRYGGAGDMIMMEPVLEALFYKYAPAEVYLRTHPDYADLHQFHPLLQPIVKGILTADQKALPGYASDEKKPQGFDRFYNTTGCVEMNRGIHGTDSFAFSTSAIPFRRTPVMYLDPDVEVQPRDIVIHTPKRGPNSPRNHDFRHYHIPDMVKNHLDKEGIKYESITAIGENSEYEGGLQEMAQTIAGAKLFIGPDSAGFHMAAALGVPHIAAFTSDFPAGIRAYPNTVSTRDTDLADLLQKISALYSAPEGPKSFGPDRVDLLSEKYAYGRTLELESEIGGGGYDLIRISGLLEHEDWRQRLWDYSERLSHGGTIFMYERHGSFDPLLLTKYLILTAGLQVTEYTATPDAYGHFFVAAQKVKRPRNLL